MVRNPGDIRSNWEQQEITSRGSLNSLSVADMNDDGRLDLIMAIWTGGSSSNWSAKVWRAISAPARSTSTATAIASSFQLGGMLPRISMSGATIPPFHWTESPADTQNETIGVAISRRK
ncbi:hypothetical protein [Mesorhizobium delmotii]|uniref:hypothetical protein n=1 Tax=Mesorhizobium delmotii TaxID=1631247 RepID=UPI001FCEB51E|nr:hypothetical protein [Mesorhizobium delmotii]